MRAIEATGLKPVINCSFSLEDAADAFRHEEGGRHSGKVRLEF